MDQRGPPGQRKSPQFQSQETRLVHVCQSARRDCRVSTNLGAWNGAQRRVRRIRLHHHPQEVRSRCTVQLQAHICELCLPTQRGNMAADRGQSGHQVHIYEMCLSAERGIMDTGKEVLFALPLFNLFSPSPPLGVSVETTTGQHIDVIANFPVGFSTPSSNPPAAQKKMEFSLSQNLDRVIHIV